MPPLDAEHAPAPDDLVAAQLLRNLRRLPLGAESRADKLEYLALVEEAHRAADRAPPTAVEYFRRLVQDGAL
jgi:hypothetical protein